MRLLFWRRLNSKIKTFLIAGFVLRMLVMFLFINLNNDYYWEYGDIAKYILDGKGYSFVFFENHKYCHGYQTELPVYISAHMPPGYVIFLLPFLLIKNIILRNILILTIQNILSLFVIYYLFKFTKKYFSKPAAILAALFYALIPEFIYVSNLYGVTIIYHLAIIALLYMLYDNNKRYEWKNVIALSLILGILINFRSEVALFALMIAGFYLLNKKFKQFIAISGIIFCLLLPWQIRNYVAFKSIVPMTTTNGWNFYLGHTNNEIYTIENLLTMNSDEFEGHFDAELRINNFLFNRAIHDIESDPYGEIKRVVYKIGYLWFLYPYDKRAISIFYIVPWFFILTFSIYGLYKNFSIRRHIFSYLFLTFHTIISVLYFVLPRYQTMMKIALLPFAASGLSIIYFNIKNKKNTIQEQNLSETL
ncbi:MAG: 2 protein [Ignavibacteria bacterium]|nr:2 protein [Ignavibacteria bacterium]